MPEQRKQKEQPRQPNKQQPVQQRQQARLLQIKRSPETMGKEKENKPEKLAVKKTHTEKKPKPGNKRHAKEARDVYKGITKPAIRRLARRGGVKRIGGDVYEEVRCAMKVFLSDVIRDAITYTDHGRRKTVTALDVVHALRRQGHTLYGF
jgi:histone H4